MYLSVPNGQGIVALMNILQEFDLSSMEALVEELFRRSCKIAFYHRNNTLES